MSTVQARFNVTAARPYNDRDGNEKKQWINLGRATQWDDGNISIELNAVPVGNWFDGKLMLFPQDDSKQEQKGQRQDRSRGGRQQSGSNFDNDDSIPF